MDYASGPYTVIIPAKEKNGSISVSINDDDILEEDEFFALLINSSSLPSRVTTNFSRIDVIILDNDGKYILRVHKCTILYVSFSIYIWLMGVALVINVYM